ncbi:putative membrane protein [Gillisia sp. Hel_I_86]|uniref:bestrophin family protein n=1 Tax=Gillisia sp. Hel_I_86 TaxID=1249981 RepID=UPI00119ACE8F|nr:bestrophin family ion channel [Gillisia sp. Hel_I_86]TVZ28777.1 putative membrane protein [Gillisia sp. Hel_I_86]
MLLNKRISIFHFLNTIKYDVLFLGSYAILVGYMDQYGFLAKISIPIALTGVFGTAVALLLGFRTNQAYERWWEARIIWGAIVNDSRTLIRQTISFYDKVDEQYLHNVKETVNRQIIWCYALGESLRNLPFSPNVAGYMKFEDISDQNVPNAILLKHSQALTDARNERIVNEFQQIQLDSTIARLCDSMGKCERIKNTVFPKAHSLLIHLIIYVFATMLPFGLDDKNVAVEIAITFFIPIIFVAIEKTSILMQDPFENQPMDTPVTDLATTIEINLKQMIGNKDIPIKEKPSEYYIL